MDQPKKGCFLEVYYRSKKISILGLKKVVLRFLALSSFEFAYLALKRKLCTVHTMAVYNVTFGDHPDSCCALLSIGGHCPRGSGATGQGTKVLGPNTLLSASAS